MKRINRGKAAGYSPTDRAEERAVQILRTLLDSDRLKSLFNVNSTIPNTDGHLHVLGDSWNPIAIFDVQIKTLTDADLKRSGYNVSCELLNYANSVAVNPVLLFGVHPKSKAALWVHLEKGLARQKLSEATGESITIRFPEKQKITKRAKRGFIDEWVRIHAKDVKAVQLFDEREVELEKARAAAAIINRTGSAVAIDGDAKKLQEFSDVLNDLFNREFHQMKSFFHPNTWKIGLGLFQCEDQGLSYTFYPISYGSTDLLIKKLDSKILNGLQGIDFVRSYASSNPIYESPKGYAYQCVSEEVKKVLELNAYKFSSDLLCREIIFGAIEKDGHGVFGLNRDKDQYSVAELRHSLENYLPCYLMVFISALTSLAPNFLDVVNVQLKTRGFVEIDDLLAIRYQLEPEVIDRIEREVARVIQDPEKHRIIFPIHSKKLQLKRYSEALAALKGDVVRRPYIKPKAVGRGGWIWSNYSLQEIFERVALVYGELPTCVESVVKHNFPLLASELDFFRDFDVLVVRVLKAERVSRDLGHAIETYQLKTDDLNCRRQVAVLPFEEHESLQVIEDGSKAIFRGTVMSVVGSSRGVYSEFFHPFPLSTKITQFLHVQLQDYFKRNGSKGSWGPRNQYQFY